MDPHIAQRPAREMGVFQPPVQVAGLQRHPTVAAAHYGTRNTRSAATQCSAIGANVIRLPLLIRFELLRPARWPLLHNIRWKQEVSVTSASSTPKK